MGARLKGDGRVCLIHCSDIGDLRSVCDCGCVDSLGVWSMSESYFDESGTHDNSVAVAFAGYSSSPEIWALFTKEWLAILDRYHLDFLHMAEFVARAEPFDKLDNDERLSLMTALVACINRFDLGRNRCSSKAARFWRCHAGCLWKSK
jgi:hypothetical protein